MMQEHETVEKPMRAFEFIRCKTKTELSPFPSEDLPIQRYQGPKHPSMPRSEATSKILPLYILAKAALSRRRANDSDFHFLILLGNGFEIPEYNGFNTKLAREAGVGLHPATHFTYMPLIIESC